MLCGADERVGERNERSSSITLSEGGRVVQHVAHAAREEQMRVGPRARWKQLEQHSARDRREHVRRLQIGRPDADTDAAGDTRSETLEALTQRLAEATAHKALKYCNTAQAAYPYVSYK